MNSWALGYVAIGIAFYIGLAWYWSDPDEQLFEGFDRIPPLTLHLALFITAMLVWPIVLVDVVLFRSNDGSSHD